MVRELKETRDRPEIGTQDRLLESKMKNQCFRQTCAERTHIVTPWAPDRAKNNLQGDSGGPLTYESGDQHILIGETSFGPLPCAQVKILWSLLGDKYVMINSGQQVWSVWKNILLQNLDRE